MTDQVQVPTVAGLTQAAAEDSLRANGLVPAATKAASPSVAAGNVISSNPDAGANVDKGSTVTMQISSGPAVTVPAAAPTKVRVPDITGLNATAAATLLESVGLKLGKTDTKESSTTPNGGVMSSTPAPNAMADAGSAVNVLVSKGQGLNWIQLSVVIAVAVLGAAILVIIIVGIFERGSTLLKVLAQPDVARGLITFLIALTTVGIALILAISTMLLDGNADEDAARFDRGKQVLTALIGILGTIVGFYYGSSSKAPEFSITTSALHDGKANTEYTPELLHATGGTSPIKWSVQPDLPMGLMLAADGTISGTPTEDKTKTSYTFTATDSETPPVSKTQQIDLTVTK